MPEQRHEHRRVLDDLKSSDEKVALEASWDVRDYLPYAMSLPLLLPLLKRPDLPGDFAAHAFYDAAYADGPISTRPNATVVAFLKKNFNEIVSGFPRASPDRKMDLANIIRYSGKLGVAAVEVLSDESDLAISKEVSEAIVAALAAVALYDDRAKEYLTRVMEDTSDTDLRDEIELAISRCDAATPNDGEGDVTGSENEFSEDFLDECFARLYAYRLYQRARVMLGRGQLDEAIAALRKSALVDPQAATFEELGFGLMTMGKYREAVEPLAAAATLRKHPSAPTLLAEVFLKLGDKLKARELARLAISMSRDAERARQILKMLEADADLRERDRRLGL